MEKRPISKLIMQKLIVLRGAPSSGKSTIAKRFRNFQEKVVWLKVDSFKDFFSEDASIALDYVNVTAVATLDYLLNQGFSVVMEGVFQNPQYIKQATELAKKRNIPYRVFQLTCSLETLQMRDKQRPGIKEGCREPLGDTVIANLYNVIENNPYKEAIELDTEKNNIEKCIEIIRQNFKENN